MAIKIIMLAGGAVMAMTLGLATTGLGAEKAGKGGVSITWNGQSCFQITAPGVSIVTDPYADKMDYADLKLKADVVTISHEHFDHNNTNAATGNPVVLRGLTDDGGWAKISQEIKGAKFRTVGTYHDATQGKERGKNAVFVITIGGLRIAHLGDLGEPLTEEKVKEIGPVDVLLVPVGGYYTIDAAAAEKVVRSLNPRIVIPMHFKTDRTDKLPISNEAAFLKLFKTAVPAGHKIELTPQSLPKQTTVYLMKYE